MSTTLFKCPKGTIDICAEKHEQLTYVLKTLESLFASYGGIPLETPVFERYDVLMGKYGEEADTKLIYELAHSGGERLALRYDHTLPFVRYAIENHINKMRRYTIGKVYRRDQPSAARFREFYQADFDILGEDSTSMLCEATLFKMIYKGLQTMGIEDFTIHYNYTQNLKAILTKIGVSDANFKATCAIIDKLDKQTFDELEIEFYKYISKESFGELKKLLEEETITEPMCVKMDELLQEATHVWGCPGKFMASLARGLDYYNGLIFEVKIGKGPSIISGGRYDGLIPDNTLIGVSFGVSRIMALCDIKYPRSSFEKVFVTTLGNISRVDKCVVIEWARKIWPCVLYDTNEKQRKLSKVLADCKDISHVIVIAETEWKDRCVIIKNLVERTQKNVCLE